MLSDSNYRSESDYESECESEYESDYKTGYKSECEAIGEELIRRVNEAILRGLAAAVT